MDQVRQSVHPFRKQHRQNLRRSVATNHTSGVARAVFCRRLHPQMILDHVARNLVVEPDDFEYVPFAQEGGLGKVHQLFGNELSKMIEDLNGALAA
ncbi:MAG: type I restriction-modification enzyme R subunit C-terminal domain-containing protein [Nitrospirota bacterium]|nr:type I restriction-modification enzyme R subunit C-terminal domain-containing protein [Nitrospirota bacterium]